MRTLSILFLLVVFMASVASAELLTTANPIGQGRFALELAGIQDSNLGDVATDAKLTTIGGYIGYGVTDKLDAYLQLGSGTSSGVTTGIPGIADIEISGTGVGLNLKYTVLSEGETMPVSMAVGVGYKSTSTTTKTPAIPIIPTPATETTVSGSEMLLGVGVSKVIVPFIPYLGIAYRTASTDGTEVSTQLDLTLGSAIAWSEQGAVFVEYTNQSITPKGGSVYTSGQIALGVAYKI